MKPLIVTLFCFLFYTATHAQKAHATPYLVVRLQQQYDDVNKNQYWKIVSDHGNPNASDIYALLPYPNGIGKAPYGVHFYNENKNDRPPFYNYFKSPTIALNYLVQNSWHLMSVVTETTSEPKELDGKTYTHITTTPVYYLKWATFGTNY